MEFWGGVCVFVRVVIAQVVSQPSIETIWPTSAAGWIGLFLAGSTAVKVGYDAIKRPAHQAAKEVEERMIIKIDKMAAELHAVAMATQRQFTDLTQDTERERRECAERMEEVKKIAADQDARLRTISEALVQSKENRRHLTDGLQELKLAFNKSDDLHRQRYESILESMVKLRGGKND
jgi:hypothetical protein